MTEDAYQQLSKEVLVKGGSDQRFLLDLCPSNWVMGTPRRDLTTQFQYFLHLFSKLSQGAQDQNNIINRSLYPIPEMISMMLEQCDYWEDDAPVIVEIANAYLKGDFNEVVPCKEA